MSENIENKEAILFGKGIENPYGEYFLGESYLNILSNELGLLVMNVTFEPKCRNNWHIHEAQKGGGQILLVTAGEGFYQEWGKEPKKLKVGDIVNIPADVKHWHGATKDSLFTHIAIEVPGENIGTKWCEEVLDEEYNKLI